MKSITKTITDPHGLISRKAAELVSVANRFSSDIFLIAKGFEPADLKSIMNVFDTIINGNDEIVINIAGSDEAKAYEAFIKLFETEDF